MLFFPGIYPEISAYMRWILWFSGWFWSNFRVYGVQISARSVFFPGIQKSLEKTLLQTRSLFEKKQMRALSTNQICEVCLIRSIPLKDTPPIRIGGGIGGVFLYWPPLPPKKNFAPSARNHSKSMDFILFWAPLGAQKKIYLLFPSRVVFLHFYSDLAL